MLVELLADLPHDGRMLAEKTLQELAGEWAPTVALQGDDALSRRFATRPGPVGGALSTGQHC